MISTERRPRRKSGLEDTGSSMTAAARKTFDEAVALEIAGDLDKALVAYLKAQELAPEDTEIAYRTASALLQAGYLEEAQSQLRRIVFAEPSHLNARASLGNCHLLQGDIANAKQNFCEVLEQVPDNRNALYGLASVFLKENLPHEASGPAKRLLELLPETPEVITLFAETQAKSNQSAAAIAAYRKALKINPDFTPALVGLADTLILRKRFDEVIELMITANRLAPADPLPLELLSDALSGKGAFADAREAGEAALKLSPKTSSILVRLSILSRKLGDNANALDYALKAHDADTEALDPFNALGSALAALKYSNQARAVLTATGRKKALDPEIRKLAEDLVSANRDQAREDLANCRDRADDHSDHEIIGTSSNESRINPEPRTTVPDQPATFEHSPENQAGDSLPPAGSEPSPSVLGLDRRDRT